MELSNAKVLLTGASRGLGRSLALALAASGARVVLVARGAEDLAEVVREIRETGGTAYPIVDDVGDPGSASRIAGTAAGLVGDLDVLVHNASALGPVPLRPLAETAVEDFERAVAVNLLGAFRLTRAVVGAMVARGRGSWCT